MATVNVDAAVLHDLLERRDELVRVIAAGVHSGDWNSVIWAFDGLPVAIARREGSLPRVDGG